MLQSSTGDAGAHEGRMHLLGSGRRTTSILHLQDRKPVAVGRARHVYEYPGSPDFLIKLLDPKGVDAVRARRRNRFAVVRYGAYASWKRELSEYCGVIGRLGYLPDCIAGFGGLVDTDIGPGMVVEHVRTRAGKTAPSLDRFRGVPSGDVPGGLDDWPDASALRDMVSRLFRDLSAGWIMASDLNLRNLVVSDSTGYPRLVLIDGLGDRTLIPVRCAIRSLYDAWLAKKHREVITRLGL